MLCMEALGGDLILPDSVNEFHMSDDFTQAAVALSNRRHLFSALRHNLKTMVSMVYRDKQPRVLAVRSLTVAKVDSIGLVVLR